MNINIVNSMNGEDLYTMQGFQIAINDLQHNSYYEVVIRGICNETLKSEKTYFIFKTAKSM